MINTKPSPKIYTNNTTLTPGFGFHYVSRAPTTNSLFSLSKTPFSLPAAKKSISAAKNAFLSQNPNFALCDKTVVSSAFINSFSDLNCFLGEGGSPLLGLLADSPSEALPFAFLREILFEETSHSFFVKCVAQSGVWSFGPQPTVVRHAEPNEFDFRRKFGDAFISKVILGSTAVFRVDVAKSEDVSLEKASDAIERIFHPEEFIEPISLSKCIESLGDHKVKLLHNTGPMIDVSKLSDVIRYIKKMAVISKKSPEVIMAQLVFYDNLVVQPDLIAGYRSSVKAFENKVLPHALDLLQCRQFLGSLEQPDAAKSDFASDAEQIETARNEINFHLKRVSDCVESFKTTQWSDKVPAIPRAEDLLQKHSVFDPKNTNERGEEPILKESEMFNVSKKSAKLKINDFQAKVVSYQKIPFNSPYGACVALQTAFAQYAGQYDVISGVPIYLLWPCEDYQETPIFSDKTAFGLSSRMFSPTTALAFKKLFTHPEVVTSASTLPMYRYIKLYKIENTEKLNLQHAVSNFGASPAPFRALRTKSDPRAVSGLDEDTFLLHQKTPSSLTQCVENITADIEAFSELEMVHRSGPMQQNILFCVEKLRAVSEGLSKLISAEILSKSSDRAIRARLDDLAYGPKAWGDRFDESADMRRALVGAVRDFAECNLWGKEREERKELVYCIQACQLKTQIDKTEERMWTLLEEAGFVLAQIDSEAGNSHLTAPAIRNIKSIEAFLRGFRNAIAEEPLLVVEKVFELNFDATCLLP